MEYIYETHCHTSQGSACGRMTGEELARFYKDAGYDGVIVTDAMDMGAITTQFGNAEAAIKSIQAGVDVVLCSREFTQVFDAVVKAVEDGEIKETRIDESVKRILDLKK